MHCERLRLANWPPGKREEERIFERRDGLMDGAGLVPMLLWTEWVSGGNIPLVFPWWQCEDEAGRKFLPVCLSGTQTGEGGPLMLLRPWV